MIRSLTITDPLVKYQSLVARGIIKADPAQHRLALHLQKLYLQLKDYSPAMEYREKLQRATQKFSSDGKGVTEELATQNHPIRRNPIFARFFRRTEGKDSLALTRSMTCRESALNVNSPKGLFLSGDVGTGKSMLLDLLADALPTTHKKRWHYHTFILHAFAAMERFQKSHSSNAAQEDPGYSLLWMAKEMVETTPILFLDEFQMPDRAASKLLNNLFLAFFQLGGVLVASSNRVPEELENAAGMQYSRPNDSGLFRNLFAMGSRRLGQGDLFGQSSDFAVFLEVLNARCDFWNIQSTKDWRRVEDVKLERPRPVLVSEKVGPLPIPEAPKAPTSSEQGDESKDQDRAGRPGYYVLKSDPKGLWQQLAMGIQGGADPAWRSANFVVYGRSLVVPRQRDGCAKWEFDELVHTLGPADYLTLASNYHTFIIDNVPALSMAMKNEARRFITALDALYEARCKLVIRAEALSDDLFFPEMRGVSRPETGGAELGTEDATYSETIAEVFQDQTSPFRPNISTYSGRSKLRYNQDQDSDFGLTESTGVVDFGKTGAFTGEDERFAYKRAASRLWEMCSERWHARTGDWWQPLPFEARHWEGSKLSRPQALTHSERPKRGAFGHVDWCDGSCNRLCGLRAVPPRGNAKATWLIYQQNSAAARCEC